MDYNLAALKVTCLQLKTARQLHSQSGASLNGILFQRAWLQGILVTSPTDDGDGRYLLDDGTGLIELFMIGDVRTRKFEIGSFIFSHISFNSLLLYLIFSYIMCVCAGMYLMVVGVFCVRDGDVPLLKVIILSGPNITV